MTKEHLLTELRTLSNNDPECNHVKADELLLEYINDDDISTAFRDIEKWYA